MTTPILELQGLDKRYGQVHALRAVTARVEPGPVGLLGPNGAGKTTLLKLLLGQLRPSSGSASIAGHSPQSSAGRMAIRRVVGYMPEGDCLLPDMTGVQLVSTLGRITGLRKQDAMTRAHETLDYVGIEEARYRSVEQYSTGMKQRLKLAQALVHDPQLLLLDEPTNGLDPRGRRHMLELVHDLGHKQRKNILLCSHLLRDVEQTCDHVLVLDKGTVVTQGSMEEMTGSDGMRLILEPTGEEHELASFQERLADAGFGLERKERQLILTLATARNFEWERDLADPIFELARESGVRIQGLDLVRSSLEQVFLDAVGVSPGSAQDQPAAEEVSP